MVKVIEDDFVDHLKSYGGPAGQVLHTAISLSVDFHFDYNILKY